MPTHTSDTSGDDAEMGGQLVDAPMVLNGRACHPAASAAQSRSRLARRAASKWAHGGVARLGQARPAAHLHPMRPVARHMTQQPRHTRASLRAWPGACAGPWAWPWCASVGAPVKGVGGGRGPWVGERVSERVVRDERGTASSTHTSSPTPWRNSWRSRCTSPHNTSRCFTRGLHRRLRLWGTAPSKRQNHRFGSSAVQVLTSVSN